MSGYVSFGTTGTTGGGIKGRSEQGVGRGRSYGERASITYTPAHPLLIGLNILRRPQKVC